MMVWADVSYTTPGPALMSAANVKTCLDGFFDAGMLLHALKGLNVDRERGNDKPERRRFVGKKLRLNEY